MRALRVGVGSLATIVLVASVSLAIPAVTLGSDGFTEQATTTYVVNPGAQRLDVSIDLTFRNTSKSTSTAFFYYDGDFVWLEKDATNVRATSSGAKVTVTPVKRSGQYDEYRFRWSPVLLYGKTRVVHITYQIPTGAPRSSSWFRISPAYLDFCVIGTGLDGGSTVIKVPLGYAMTIDSQENGQLGSRIDGDTRIYTTGTLDNAFKFWACLTGEQETAFTTTKLSAPSGREIDIQAWPDDPSWATDISRQIDQVLTQLEALIGQGLPGDGPISVREVGQGTLGQYAGFFDPETGVARIGEDLEATGLITHELSHAWFNGNLFQSHWLSEGYAEWARTSIDTDTCPTPTYPGAGSPNLEQWQFAGPRATDEELAIVDYQYAAACALVRQVAARLGDDGMRAVLAALTNHDLAYRSGPTVLKGPNAAASWQTWLDVIDEVGLASGNTSTGVATVADLLAPYGITTSSTAALQQRADARQAFHLLDAMFDTWHLPPVVLQAMASWHFDTATTAMATARKVWEESGQVGSVLAGADGVNGPPRTMMEAATTQAQLDAALAAADDRLAAAHEVADAEAAWYAQHDLATQVGLIGTDLKPTIDAAIQAIQDGDVAAARSGVQAIQAALADAPNQGQVRLLIGIGIPLLLLVLVGLLLIRRRRRRAALAGAAAATMPNLAALDAALAPPPAPISPLGASDPDPADVAPQPAPPVPSGEEPPPTA